jgi:hydroxyacylglutathione hydrolase
VRLTPSVHLVGSGAGGFSLSHEFDCHVYLLDGGGEAALIDSGIGRDTDTILSNIEAAGVELDRLRLVVLTHAHADHSGGAAALRARLPQLRVAATTDVARWVSEGDEQALSIARGKRAGLYPARLSFEPCEVDTELAEGSKLSVGALEVEAIETPGHSDGHLALRVEVDTRVMLFSGDLVFFGGQISLLNNWDCRIQEYARSVVKLDRASIDALLPGHHFISLNDGQRHIDAAARLFKRGLVPKSVI